MRDTFGLRKMLAADRPRDACIRHTWRPAYVLAIVGLLPPFSIANVPTLLAALDRFWNRAC